MSRLHCLLDAGRQVQKSLRWQVTTSSNNVHPIMKEFNIEHGYRLTGWPWKYYLASALQFHNETINWMSHLCGAVAILGIGITTLHEGQSANADFRDLGVVALFVIASVLLQLVSALAHLFHNKSELTHCLLFFADNAAAGITAMATNCVFFVFVSTDNYFHNYWKHFLIFHSVGTVLVSGSYSLALAAYRRSYNTITSVLMFGPTGLFVAIGNYPLVHRYLLSQDPRVYIYLLVTLFFLCGVIFYATYFPERYMSGYFDILGHSHQWFHLGCTASHYLLVVAMRRDIAEFSEYLLSKRSPDTLTLDMLCYLFVSVLFAQLVIVCALFYWFRYDTQFKSNVRQM